MTLENAGVIAEIIAAIAVVVAINGSLSSQPKGAVRT